MELWTEHSHRSHTPVVTDAHTMPGGGGGGGGNVEAGGVLANVHTTRKHKCSHSRRGGRMRAQMG